MVGYRCNRMRRTGFAGHDLRSSRPAEAGLARTHDRLGAAARFELVENIADVA